MSEALPGVPAPPPPPTPRVASAVILFRRTPDGPEVFWLKREKWLRFAGGFYAFPGGKVDREDRAVTVRGAEGEAAALIVAAARELFEEAGILVARGPRLAQPVLDEFRREVLVDGAAFRAGLERLSQHLDVDDFPYAGRWATPPWLPVRFDARFFLVEAPADQLASVWPGELESGEWTTPARALECWQDGRAFLHPPNLHALEVMNRFTTTQHALEELRGAPFVDSEFVCHRIEFQRGALVFPQETPTLPPATHTNTWILGTQECLIVDPGSPDETAHRRLVEFVRALGYQPRAIVLTHHHGDHVGGAQHLAEWLRLPIWAHSLTAERLDFRIDRHLEPGEVLELKGPLTMRWQVLHTPGHAPGHIVLVNEATRLGVVGDMVAGLGTIVIDPSDGNMSDYVRQLERLKTHVTALAPAHGPLIPDAISKLDEYLMHRAWRQQKVLDALKTFSSAVTADELVERAYDDVQAFVWPIAQRNTLTILEKLRAEGLAEEHQGRWSVTQT